MFNRLTPECKWYLLGGIIGMALGAGATYLAYEEKRKDEKIIDLEHSNRVLEQEKKMLVESINELKKAGAEIKKETPSE